MFFIDYLCFLSLLLINVLVYLKYKSYKSITFNVNKNNIAMKKNIFKNKNARVKVAKLKSNSFENGVIIFIALLIVTNLLISLKILFG